MTWKSESERHVLASKGVKTKKYWCHDPSNSDITIADIMIIDDAIHSWERQRNNYRNDAEQFMGDWENQNPQHKRLADIIFEEINHRGDN